MFKGFKFGKSGQKGQPEDEDIANLVAGGVLGSDPIKETDSEGKILDGNQISEGVVSNGTPNEEGKENINIFDDFSLDEDLQKDVKDFNKEKSRDTYDYLSFVSGTLTYINLVIFLVIVTAFSYVFIQKDQDIYDASWLDPVCNYILGEIPYGDYSYCSSVTHMGKVFKEKLEKVKKEQYAKIVEILPDVYKRYDFINSREMVFLVSKKENRLRPSKIIEDFHRLKDEFSPVDKEVISCKDITISSNNILKINCEARSSAWNSGIKGYQGSGGDRVNGTSISMASSFFNFIDLESEEFTLINSPKDLGVQITKLSESGYDRKTYFTLELQYNTDNISL